MRSIFENETMVVFTESETSLENERLTMRTRIRISKKIVGNADPWIIKSRERMVNFFKVVGYIYRPILIVYNVGHSPHK